ncbi:MAG: ImmA/IrrE family metallo-endopeptidase [Nitrospira sp.]|nr:ImmA/IrrE family metallo-endopeptidase [Nitrospira sp.]
MVRLRRGFRKEAEEYALEFREELGLEEQEPLNPFRLAEHLAVPIHALSEHPTIPRDIKRHFQEEGNSTFSAFTLVDGIYNEIIHNDSQHPNRQHSNISHELAHIILYHPPRPPLLNGSCRNFDPIREQEANELGFTLLVPNVAALYAIEGFSSLRDAAEYYGVSQDLLKYRIRITNAKAWAKNRRSRSY